MNKSKIVLIIIAILANIFFSCKNEKQVSDNSTLILSASYKLNVIEPSGLTLDRGMNKLWTVSDENSKIYSISLKGETLDSLTVNGEDLEGVCDSGDDNLTVVLERTRELVELSKSGKEIKRKALDLKGELNEGLEGIAYNENNDEYFIINEKNPRLLIRLNNEFDELSRDTLKWASDFSGLCYDEIENVLWVISDESKVISKCNLDGSVIQNFKIDLPQIEGIAVDIEANKIFIVSDITAYLYVFTIKEKNG
jgi:uncharacterized protein YjiK